MKEFEVKKTLGTGSYGRVVLVLHQPSNVRAHIFLR